MNDQTKILIKFIESHKECCKTGQSAKTLCENLVLDHGNHLLVMALAASALKHVDWEELERIIEAL